MAAETVVNTLGKALQDDSKPESEPGLQFKDFVWDQFIKYISSAILALTILNLSVEFLRGGGVLCFPPILTKDVIDAETNEVDKGYSVRQIDFFNGYCSRSIPHSEFFPLYILVHGILLIAPHFIWTAVFKGDFDSFFAVTRKLDRLRDRNTGEYDPTNFDRVEKLEIEFGSRRKIFLFYIGKLLLQLCVCIGSYIFSAVFFINFATVFDCPKDLAENDVIPDKWPLNVTIPCIYTSLRILSLVRYADYILLGLAVCLILMGLLWCAIRHTKELGHSDIANFVFQSCLSTKTYVFPPFYEVRRRMNHSDNCWFCCYPFALVTRACHGCIVCGFEFKIFSPRIKNDLDFFELYLFRADTSHGRVFKEIQIDKALKKLQGEDHQLLHLFLDAQRDMSAQIRDKEIAEAERQRQSSQGGSSVESGAAGRDGAAPPQQQGATPSGGGTTAPTQQAGPMSPDLSRVEDLASFFKMGPGGFSRNPETFAFIQLQEHLSNIKWRPVEGIRDRLYGFVLYSPKHVKGDKKGQPKTDMALDISFGSSGYALVLARAFKRVVSVNFHPFFRNEKEPVKKRAYYTNYFDVNLPVDIFTQVNTNINKANEKMFEHMRKPVKKPADFIVVGPLTEDSQIVTVTLTIETLHTVGLIEEGAILLAVRPLKIGHRVMTKKFHKYEPSIALFDGSIHKTRVITDLKSELGDEAEIMVEDFSGIRVECGDTECIFEFVTFKYKGEKRKDPTIKPAPLPPPPTNQVPAPPPSNVMERSKSMPTPIPPQVSEALEHFFHTLGGTFGQLRSPTPPAETLIPARDRSSSVPQGVTLATPNNDAAAQARSGTSTQQLLPDNNRRGSGNGVNGGMGRGGGRGLIRMAPMTQSLDSESRGSVSEQGGRGRSYRRSSSTSGIASSSSQFGSLGEEDAENLPQSTSSS